jgi:hypothetical protein
MQQGLGAPATHADTETEQASEHQTLKLDP